MPRRQPRWPSMGLNSWSSSTRLSSSPITVFRFLTCARDVGIGANAEAAAEFVGPVHEILQHAGGGVRVQRVGLALEDLARGAIERDPVAFLQGNQLADAGGFRAAADNRVASDAHGVR